MGDSQTMQPGKQSGIRRVTSWQLVGAQLRHFRKLAGLTQAALAELAKVGEDTISSIEQGRRALQPDLATTLDKLLDTKGALRVAVEGIPRKERYQALVNDFVQYEQSAVSLYSYQSQLIPGLLQTEAYARFIFGCNYPPLEEEEIEQRVADRLDRQKILERRPRPILHFILEESILHTQLGDPEVMLEQLLHLRRCMDLPFVTVQIMPRSAPPARRTRGASRSTGNTRPRWTRLHRRPAPRRAVRRGRRRQRADAEVWDAAYPGAHRREERPATGRTA